MKTLDEQNRVIVERISDLLFVYKKQHSQNLLNESHGPRMEFVGDGDSAEKIVSSLEKHFNT
jgi:UDP-N-acetylglucosamine 2-epimerase